MKSADLLIELGTEELPPGQLVGLSENFAQLIVKQLQELSLNFSGVKHYATPRRIALIIDNLELEQPTQEINRKGPPTNANEKAINSFADSCGVKLSELQKVSSDKGEWYYYKGMKPGAKTSELLPEIITHAVNKLPIKKRMRWNTAEFEFVRPMHWLLVIHGKQVVPVKIFGIESDNKSYGHRFHFPKSITISTPSEYEQKLEKNKVIVDIDKRKDIIRKQIAQNNGGAIIDESLLNTVNGLVEFPVLLTGGFNPAFLEVPNECLIAAMQDHQKCFPVFANGKLDNKFIIISNIESKVPETVVKGNELVINARLADAAFHFKKDKLITLSDRIPNLNQVLFADKLGTLGDKVSRIENLAVQIAENLSIDTAKVAKAAKLCKSDLLTNMVYEFPELQGIMGKYYAHNDGISEDIAESLEQYYWPRFADDKLPTNKIAICLALADRLDSLMGFFSIGKMPTGEKDPFALRRQALAVIRIIVELKLNYTLHFSDQELAIFFIERLKHWYSSHEISKNIFSAVVHEQINDLNLPDIDQRIKAVVKFMSLPQAESLSAANKRVSNLLKKNTVISSVIDEKLLEDPAEKLLYAELLKKEAEIENEQNYETILLKLSTLQQPIDDFFEKVMVMVDNNNIKNNRCNLLARLQQAFKKVADISEL